MRAVGHPSARKKFLITKEKRSEKNMENQETGQVRIVLQEVKLRELETVLAVALIRNRMLQGDIGDRTFSSVKKDAEKRIEKMIKG